MTRLESMGTRLQKSATIVLLASLAVFGGSLLWLLITGAPLDDDLPQAIPLTLLGSILVPVFCVGGLMAGTVIRRGEMPVVMSVAVLASLGAVAAWLVMTARALGRDPADPVVAEAAGVLPAFKVALTLTVLGLGLPAAGLLLTSSHEQRALVVCRAILLTAGTVAAAGILLLMWSRWWQSRSFVLAIAVAAGIAGTLLGGLALLGASWTVRRAGRAALGSLPGRPTLELRCPDCGEQQVMPAGIGRCRGCGLVLMIDVEEPRCACGYLLFRLHGDECPECGRKVTAPARGPSATGG